MDSIQKKQLGSALGSVPSGCFIMTSGDEKTGTGLLASWVQQCSFDPPMVTVCVKEGRPIEAAVMESGRFVLNIIGDSPGEMFGHFGKGFGPGESAFEEITKPVEVWMATRSAPEWESLSDEKKLAKAKEIGERATEVIEKQKAERIEKQKADQQREIDSDS